MKSNCAVLPHSAQVKGTLPIEVWVSSAVILSTNTSVSRLRRDLALGNLMIFEAISPASHCDIYLNIAEMQDFCVVYQLVIAMPVAVMLQLPFSVLTTTLSPLFSATPATANTPLANMGVL